MRRRLERQRPNEQAPYGAHSHCSEQHCRLKHHSKRQTHHSAQTRTDLYGADQQQRKEWINFFVLYVHVYVVNACAGYRGGLDMAVHQPSRAHLARRRRRRRWGRRRHCRRLVRCRRLHRPRHCRLHRPHLCPTRPPQHSH